MWLVAPRLWNGTFVPLMYTGGLCASGTPSACPWFLRRGLGLASLSVTNSSTPRDSLGSVKMEILKISKSRSTRKELEKVQREGINKASKDQPIREQNIWKKTSTYTHGDRSHICHLHQSLLLWNTRGTRRCVLRLCSCCIPYHWTRRETCSILHLRFHTSL